MDVAHIAAEQASTSLPTTPAQFLASATVAAVLLLVFVGRSVAATTGSGTRVSRRSTPRRRRRRGLITGLDNRYSTSKVIALGWSVLVAWMVVSEAYLSIATAMPFTDLLSSASDLYFVLLGGPYAAAAFAKASVQTKIAQGSLTKTESTAPSFLDVVADDNGDVDLVDFQYTMFNLLALLIVLVSFAAAPLHGLPGIPQFLAILTGGSALTYSINKAIATDTPQIVAIVPGEARVGDVVEIHGSQLVPPAAGSVLPTVSIGGITASGVAVAPSGSDRLVATVTGAPANTKPLNGPVDVVVVPASGTPIISHDCLTIVADGPTLDDIIGGPFTESSLVELHGSFLLSPGSAPRDATTGAGPEGATVSLQTASGIDWPVSFTGVYSNTSVGLRVGLQPDGITQASDDHFNATITFVRGNYHLSTALAMKKHG